MTVGKNKWESLPEDVRAILEETAKETQAYVYAKAAEMEDDLLGKIKAAGVEVNEADKQAFVDASAPIYKEFSESFDGAGEMVDGALALASTD